MCVCKFGACVGLAGPMDSVVMMNVRSGEKLRSFGKHGTGPGQFRTIFKLAAYGPHDMLIAEVRW